MFLSNEELKNLTVLVEVGAKSISNEKGLQESAAIQTVALELIRKLHKAHEKPPEEPKAD